jgi:hypothetical protein
MRLMEVLFFATTLCLYVFVIADGFVIALLLALLAWAAMKAAGIFRDQRGS